jgi:rSAM/selenodomain-associated transferase 1
MARGESATGNGAAPLGDARSLRGGARMRVPLRGGRGPHTFSCMRRIALLARRPAAGEVKTRLSPAVPRALVLKLYRAMLDDAIALIAGVDAGERFVYWTGASAGLDGVALPPGIEAREQAGGDLGERMERAFDDLIHAPDQRAVILGADCPALEASVLAEAFRVLDSHDAVLGPASDGGYYLVGLRRPAPGLFHGIEWSTQLVLDQTLERAARSGLTIALLPALDDLDTPGDLLRWIASRAEGGGPGAPRALDRALRAMGLLPP